MSERDLIRAGAMTVEFGDGELRYFRIGEKEVLRRVYVAVRDKEWRTIPGKVTGLHSEIGTHLFYFVFRMRHESEDGNIGFEWEGSLVGAEDGSVTFSMDGIALTNFKSNRIGFCVLHPASAAGAEVRVLHTDNTIEEGVLPELIAPHQPFFDIRGITHKVSSGSEPAQWLETRFAGDVFEMEDQRNWTDASFKTYSTPLSLPYPVQITAGTKIQQSVSIRLVPPLPEPSRGIARFVNRFIEPQFTVFRSRGATPLSLPQIGFSPADRGETKLLELLTALKPTHLRATAQTQGDYDGSKPLLLFHNSDHVLPDVPREVAFTLSGDGTKELNDFASWVKRFPRAFDNPIARILLFHRDEKSTDTKWVKLAKEILHPAGIMDPIYAGTEGNFTELNRGRPALGDLDGVTYSINPQVHAFDDASIVETFEAIPLTAQTARSFAPGLPISISPVTLRPRDATMPLGDPRQATLFGAGWTLGVIEAMARAGVQSTTFLAGAAQWGLMDTDIKKFRWNQDVPSAIFPLYYVFRDLADFQNGVVIPLEGFDRLQMIALQLRKGSLIRTLYANLTRKPLRVFHTTAQETVTVFTLDETTQKFSLTDPEAFRISRLTALPAKEKKVSLSLKPHAYVRVDEKSTV